MRMREHLRRKVCIAILNMVLLLQTVPAQAAEAEIESGTSEVMAELADMAVDITVSQKMTVSGNGIYPELEVSDLVILNHSDAVYLAVDSIAADTSCGAWTLTSGDTDFINMKRDQKCISLCAEEHDLSEGDYHPAALLIAPEAGYTFELDGKTGPVTEDIEEEHILNLVISISAAGTVVPEGCTYTIAATGEVRNPGELMPLQSARYDVYTTPDYEYKRPYSGGWSVKVLDTGKSSYSEILSSVADMAVTSMSYTFYNCTMMEAAPVIPDSITSLSGAFQNCSLLSEIPEIPAGVTDLTYAFYGTAISKAPVIPAGVTSLNYTFYRCRNLEKAPVIPEGVTSMEYTFGQCTSLSETPKLPSTVKNLKGTFNYCKIMIDSPEIPSGVTNMRATFQSCTSLLSAPSIPQGVTDLYETFYGCEAITEGPEIPDSVTDMTRTFQLCGNMVSAQSIPSSVLDMTGTFLNCSSLTGSLQIDAEPSSYSSCFAGTLQPIVLTGICSDELKAALAATAGNGNVTW